MIFFISTMFGRYPWVFVAMMVILGRNRVHATVSAEEWASIRGALEPFVIECIEEFGVTAEQIEAVKNEGIHADIDPCFISCFFKKAGTFTNEGTYDVDKSLEHVTPHIKNEEDLAIFDKIIKECAKVNDEEVSDGEKGCERAKLLTKCFKDHKVELE